MMPLTPLLRRASAVLAAAAIAPAMLVLALRAGDTNIVRSIDNGGDWYARTPGWFTTRGLFPTEHAPDGTAFAWAGGRLRLQIPQLDRGAPRVLHARVRSGRGAGEAPAVLRVLVDGIDAPAATVGADWQEIEIPLPPARTRGATISIDAQNTFTPGPQDPRALGFMLDRLSLSGTSALIPSFDVLLALALFAGAIAAAAALAGLPAWSAMLAGVAGAAVATWLLMFDAAFLGTYGARLVPLAAGVLIAAIAAWFLSSLASAATRQAWRSAALITIVVTAVRFAVFLHPDAPIGDGMFHVHRAQAVRAGDYIFTSITPRPFYEFPYPVGLYVAAQPAWETMGDRVFLLRALTFMADGLVALALFGVIAARWRSTSTAILATVLALALPAVTQSISTANLTNVFAQSCFSLALAWIGWNVGATRRGVAAIGAIALLSAAYLSHFSTAVIGLAAAPVIVIAVAFARDPEQSRSWRWAALAVAASMILSYALYYSHFHEVYARTWSRIGQEGADTSFVATLAEHSESKPVTVLRFLLANYGWGGLALTVIGALAAMRRHPREGWTLALFGFSLVVAGFLLLGAITPIEMRAGLAAHPIVASFAALGGAVLWNSGRSVFRIAAVIAAGSIVLLGAIGLRAALG